MKRRGSGILCHITSLPSPYGIGDLGPGAYAFADFLHEAKQSYWQILPLNPTNRKYADSPFSTMSSCAGNTIVLSPDLLVEEGLLTQAELSDRPDFGTDTVDYPAVARFKEYLFKKAHARFRERDAPDPDFVRFCNGHAAWLEDHALFSALYDHLGGVALSEWPEEIRNRNPEALQKMRDELKETIDLEKFLQYMFYRQWNALKNHCNLKYIQLIGDFPLFMNYDSVDIWVHTRYFRVDENKRAYVVAGAPPDDFSADGQIFNCAVYDWEELKKDEFGWWLQRFHYLFALYDYVRIDHFRGLVAYWEVPAGDKNAINGRWQPAKYSDFMNALFKRFSYLPVVAEDLGTITADIREAMAVLDIPGIKVLMLAFDKVDFESVYLPHNHIENCVVYTGTHDTNTVIGMYREASREERAVFADYIGKELGEDVNWDYIRVALMSVANTAMIQMQDVLGAGGEARMNYPGRAEGNWLWRFREGYQAHARRLAEMTMRYGRAR